MPKANAGGWKTCSRAQVPRTGRVSYLMETEPRHRRWAQEEGR